MEHLSDCMCVQSTYERMCAASGLMDEWQSAYAFLQRRLNGSQLQAIAALLFAVGRVRGTIAKGMDFHGADDLIRHMASLTEHPWLACTGPKLTEQERREQRALQPQPVAEDTIFYRADGAARGQRSSQNEVQSSFGAARWEHGVVVGECCRLLPACTNNRAEYQGLLACVADALQRDSLAFCFQLDSLLVVKQCTFQWRCRDASLQPLFAEAIRRLRQLEGRGAECPVLHIHREFNAHADGLANHALNTRLGFDYNWFV